MLRVRADIGVIAAAAGTDRPTPCSMCDGAARFRASKREARRVKEIASLCADIEENDSRLQHRFSRKGASERVLFLNSRQQTGARRALSYRYITALTNATTWSCINGKDHVAELTAQSYMSLPAIVYRSKHIRIDHY